LVRSFFLSRFFCFYQLFKIFKTTHSSVMR
jgi:hypothetical protein